MKVKTKNYTTKITHLINIATIFDFFYSDIEMSKELKEKFRRLFYNTYKEVKKSLKKYIAEYEKRISRGV